MTPSPPHFEQFVYFVMSLLRPQEGDSGPPELQLVYKS